MGHRQPHEPQTSQATSATLSVHIVQTIYLYRPPTMSVSHIGHKRNRQTFTSRYLSISLISSGTGFSQPTKTH